MPNTISQLTTANTFNHWLIASQQLIATANLLTEGNGSTFYANTKLEIGGSAAQLNVRTSAGIETLWANTATVGNVRITGNVTQTLNVSSNTHVGGNLFVFGDTTTKGNLSVTGPGHFADNLSVIGTTKLDVATANGLIANNTVTTNIFAGNTVTSNTMIYANNEIVSGNLTANLLTGNANTQIYNSIRQARDESLVFAIVLG